MLRRNGTFCSLRLGRCHSFGFGSSGPSSGISSGKCLIRICLFATNAAGAVVGHSASVPVRVASCCIVQPLSVVGISASYPTAGTGNAIQRRRLRLVGSSLFLDIAVVKWVSAFRTEFRRMSWVFRLPAAFVAFVQRLCFRFLCAALWAEFAFVDCAAGAYPAFLCRCCFRFLCAALRTEFAGDDISASTLPAVSRRLRHYRSGRYSYGRRSISTVPAAASVAAASAAVDPSGKGSVRSCRLPDQPCPFP